MIQGFGHGTWGSRSLRLGLPVAGVRFRGLSEAQYHALRDAYPDFIADSAAGSRSDEVTCTAYRLDRPLQVPVEALSANGQYTPIMARDARRIRVTGINFEASLEPRAAGMVATLGVAGEHEFAQPNVVENFLRIFSAHWALEQGGVVLHSAGLVFADKAWVFSGRSRAGKTTLSRKAHAVGARVLSDDINLLLPVAGGYCAHAVPFTGEFGRTLQHGAGRKSYPVAAIVLLEQGEELAAGRVGSARAVARLLTACPFVNDDAEASGALFDVLSALAASVPVVRLLSRKGDTVEAIMDKLQGEVEK